jgi:ABC-2 type transport system permease protein
VSAVWIVARWEFLRFFKPKDLVVTMIVIVASGLGAEAVGRALRDDAQALRIAVQPPAAAASFTSTDRFEFVGLHTSEDSLRTLLAAKDVDGILTLRSTASYDLLVRKPPAWTGELQTTLSLQAQSARLAEAGLDPELLSHLLVPIQLRSSVLDGGATRPGKITAAIVVGLMLLGVFVGNSYVFVSITGEKTQRVTEQMLAIIRPQTWVDGKILGLSAVVLAGLVGYVIGFALYLATRTLIWGKPFDPPPLMSDPGLLLLTTLLAALGFLFWFTAFAAFAATINDPNNSSRSALMFLPMLPLSLAFLGLDTPDSGVMRILSVLPGSSSAVLPVRLVLGDVTAYEGIAAVVLLLVSVGLLRRAAGKIFGLGMLMQGKEPTLREMARWARQA